MQDEILNQPTPSPVRPLALRYGLLTALALFVVGLILEFSGLVDPIARKGTLIANILNLAVLFGGLYLATQEYKKQSGNSITFGKALGFATWVSLFIALATVVFSLLQIYVINPDMVEMIREASIEDMESRGMSEEQIEQGLAIMKIFTSPLAISITAAFITFVMAFIVSLATSAIHQNAKSQDVV